MIMIDMNMSIVRIYIRITKLYLKEYYGVGENSTVW